MDKKVFVVLTTTRGYKKDGFTGRISLRSNTQEVFTIASSSEEAKNKAEEYFKLNEYLSWKIVSSKEASSGQLKAIAEPKKIFVWQIVQGLKDFLSSTWRLQTLAHERGEYLKIINSY